MKESIKKLTLEEAKELRTEVQKRIIDIQSEALSEREKEIQKRAEVLKKSHRRVYSLIVEDDGEIFVGYIKSPDRVTMSAAYSLFQRNNIVQAVETILNSCWLEGDEIIKTDDDFFFSIMGSVSQIMERKVSSVKKL